MKSFLHKSGLLALLIILITACSGSGSGSTATFNLTVVTDGPGTGTVTSAPAGIDCGTDCSESYTENTVVSLTASPAAGSLFTGWSGACSATDSCAVTMDAAKSVTATFVEYSVDCSSYAAYSSGLDPIVRSSGTASTTVIMMHGKAAMPDDVYLLPFYDELSVAGYDVVAPFMPWRHLDWDGSMCEAMNYIDELAAQEAIKGNTVIIAGHSMGGAHALIYAATSPAAAVKAIVTLAPGHFPQLELPLLTVLDPITAASITSSIAKAEDMVANDFGDQLDTFDTLIPDLNNPLLQISATANDYLSYHALYQYPDINDVLPSIKLPVLWLAGAEDPLTDFYDMPALFSRITSPISTYQDVSGDHLGMVSNSAARIEVWIPLLGL